MNIHRRAGYILKVIIPVLIWINECSSDSKLSDNMIKRKTVKDKIMNGYDKWIRPTKENSNTTEVISGVIPRQILEVDEERALFVMDSYFWMRWEDPRLTWNTTTEYDGFLQLPRESIWIPDLSVFNSHSMQVNPAGEVLLLIMPTGTVLWVPPILTQTSCPSLSETKYPNDVITCIIQLGSWTHDGWEVDFTQESIETLYWSEFVNIHPRWELIISEAKVVHNVTFYEGYDEPYLSIDIIFPLKRRSPPEIEATRSPCILIMLFTLSIFWMPPDSSKKLLLGGIAFIALTILQVYVAWSTKYPLGVVFAISFLQSTMYIVAVTLLLQVLIIFNLCNISGPVRPPPAAMQLLTGPLGTYACLRLSARSDDIPIDRVQLKEDGPSAIESPTPKDDWLLFAAGLDRLFFVLMSIAMIAIHHL